MVNGQREGGAVLDAAVVNADPLEHAISAERG
jgi:hypothetical protein